jgi:hypothetical protein
VAYDWKTELPGTFSHHSDNCPARDGGECTCGPLGYRSSIRDWKTNRRTVSPVYETVVEALAWQQDQLVSSDASRGTALDRRDLGALVDEFLQAAEDGLIRDAREARYTHEGVRTLRGALSYAESELGTMDVQDIRRRHVQALIEQLHGSGVATGRIVAVTDALRALYAYAIRRELVGFSPMVELELPPSDNGVPQSVPTPVQAETTSGGGWTTSGEPWTSPPPVGPPWTPPPFDAYAQHTNGGFTMPQPEPPPPASPYTPPRYTTEQQQQQQPQSPYPPPWYTAEQPPPPSPYTTSAPYTPPAPYATPGYTAAPTYAPQPTPPPFGSDSGVFSGMFSQPTGAPSANYDATMQERWLWWTVRIIVIVFVLIALVLVAESV